MKDLITVVLATAWVLEVIWLQRIRRHPYERPDHVDRDFRDLVARAHRGLVRCPVHGPTCIRAIRAVRTGLSHTDEDAGRRA